MLEAATPEWFIDSCKKIKYMFPRAHAAAYVMMAFRIAYFKVHYPAAFYATYFSVRSDTFDAITCQGGLKKVTAQLKELLRKKPHELNVKQKELITILEVVMEMNLRGIVLLPVDVYKSDAARFKIEGNALRPAINALSGVGTVAAENIVAARSDGPFLSNEDFQRRAKVSSAVIATLRDAGAIEALPETDQLSMF
ncbi:DNA polymerase III PolC-type [bioreactor metagenome]|uniref:DNA polymerase III PolC-type n=1 Tax=bioreactor metagenome TaxID=1076179 RepID=A0A645AXY0_9ZZZZ